jgi:hypothetical protein
MPALRRAIELRDLGTPGRFGLDLDAEWTANGHCTAGYLAAVVAHAALVDGRATFPTLTAVDVRYAHVLAPRYVAVEVDPVRVGAGGADWRVTVIADDEPCVAAMVSTGDPSEPERGLPPPDVPERDGCVLLPTTAPGFDLPVMGVMAQYADPAGLSWLGGEPSGRGTAQGWVVPTDESDVDGLSLLAAFDSIPTATYDLGLPGWAATVDMSVHVLGAPVAGPLRLRRTVRATAGPLVSLTCDVWDADSRHVATGHQLCTLRS